MPRLPFDLRNRLFLAVLRGGTRDAFLELPAHAFEACERRPGQVSSQALVRYRGVDYSVPAQYAHRQVLFKGYVDEVVIA